MINKLKNNLVYPIVFLLTLFVPMVFDKLVSGGLSDNTVFLTFVVFCPMGLIILGLVRGTKNAVHHMILLALALLALILINPGVEQVMVWKSLDWVMTLGLCYIVGMIHSIAESR